MIEKESGKYKYISILVEIIDIKKNKIID